MVYYNMIEDKDYTCDFKYCLHQKMTTPYKKTYIYIHICCVNNWADVLDTLLFKIRDSGLYKQVDKIRCCILGYPEGHSVLLDDPKIEILQTNPNIHLFEPFTINRLYTDACNADEPFRVLYLHTKGIRHDGMNPNVVDWVNYLCYFNIYHYKECIHLLDTGFSTVGVNLQTNPILHYSGNFWWSTSTHITNVGPCIFTIYQSPEYWITEKNLGDHACLAQSNVNHYDDPYPPNNYVNKQIELTYYKKSDI